MARSSFYVTTPIYYVNAAPHLGHAYTTIAADVLARHQRQRGEDVFFLTGTDEHGEPVKLAAEREGVTPEELADRNAERFQALAPRLNASNDFFIRTSDPRHVAQVQEVLTRVKDNGHVYEGVYEGWYCPRCADFKTEREIARGQHLPDPQDPARPRARGQLVLPALGVRRSRSSGSTPSARTSSCRACATTRRSRSSRAGCRTSRSRAAASTGASRSRGIPSQVFYVWLDALLNYYTALSFAREGEDLTDRFWPASFHVIGKDILKFHAVYWPALLMAADLPRAPSTSSSTASC